MKQLFIDILTKCVPDDISENYIHYTINRPEHKDNIYILWRKVDSETNIKTELFIPFQDPRYYQNGNKRIFILEINTIEYQIKLNALEVNEVEHLIYQIFQQYQVNVISGIKNWIKENTGPKTTEQKFEAAQEKVAEDNGNE